MKKLVVVVISSLAILTGCSKENVPDIQANAAATWRQAGFEVIGYEGYKYGPIGGTWGGEVWYTVRRIPDNGVIYHGYVAKWDGNYELYNITAIDAIKAGK